MTACCFVSEAPHWTENTTATRNVFVNDTRQLVFHCTGRGNPAPLIRWTKDRQTLDGSGTAWYTVQSTQQPVDTYSTSVTSTLSWQGTVWILKDWQIAQMTNRVSYKCLLITGSESILFLVTVLLSLIVEFNVMTQPGDLKSWDDVLRVARVFLSLHLGFCHWVQSEQLNC